MPNRIHWHFDKIPVCIRDSPRELHRVSLRFGFCTTTDCSVLDQVTLLNDFLLLVIKKFDFGNFPSYNWKHWGALEIQTLNLPPKGQEILDKISWLNTLIESSWSEIWFANHSRYISPWWESLENSSGVSKLRKNKNKCNKFNNEIDFFYSKKACVRAHRQLFWKWRSIYGHICWREPA